MTSAVQQKNVTFLEWSVQTRNIVYSFPLMESGIDSNFFMFKDRKCRLEFYTDNVCPTNTCLLIKRFGTQLTELEIMITVFWFFRSSQSSDGPERVKIKSDYDRIWENKAGKILGDSLTFQIHAELSQDLDVGAVKKSQKSLDYVHFQALSRDFSMLFNDNSNYDVEITCDGKKFKAHRIVLGTRSPVLSAMLKSEMVEGKEGLIKIEDTKDSIFEYFLRYLYSGTLPKLNMDTAKEFYNVADKYDVKELKTACSEFLTKNLSEANACEMLVLADQHSDSNFQNDVISYIVEKKVPQHDSQWSDFCNSYPLLAVGVQNLYIQKYCPK